MGMTREEVKKSVREFLTNFVHQLDVDDIDEALAFVEEQTHALREAYDRLGK